MVWSIVLLSVLEPRSPIHFSSWSHSSRSGVSSVFNRLMLLVALLSLLSTARSFLDRNLFLLLMSIKHVKFLVEVASKLI